MANDSDRRQARGRQAKLGRRAFIAGALTATAASGIAAAAAGTGRVRPNPAGEPDGVSYRETEHIRQFYDRCRF